MTPAKLLNLAPIMIMIAVLVYASSSIHTSTDNSVAGPSGLTKGADAVVHGIVTAGDAVAQGLGGLRDPFYVRLKHGAVADTPQSQDVATLGPSLDTLAEIVQGLTLGATFVKGAEQMAIINGQVYHRGQHLLLDGASDQSPSPLLVFNVLPTKVVLEANGKYFVLGYPDKLGIRIEDSQ